MCIGIPMQVVAPTAATPGARPRRARAPGHGAGRRQPPGTWVLGFHGAARQVLSDIEAAQARAGRQALAAVLAGDGSVDDFFADLVGREPELPGHLRSRPCMNAADRSAVPRAGTAPAAGSAWWRRPAPPCSTRHFRSLGRPARRAMLVFVDDPVRYKETLDLAVIVPELHAARAGGFRVGAAAACSVAALAPRYGFARWPALRDAARRPVPRRGGRHARLGRVRRRARPPAARRTRRARRPSASRCKRDRRVRSAVLPSDDPEAPHATRSTHPDPQPAARTRRRLEYMPMPRGMATFEMPRLPEPGPGHDVAGARDVLAAFLSHFEDWLARGAPRRAAAARARPRGPGARRAARAERDAGRGRGRRHRRGRPRDPRAGDGVPGVWRVQHFDASGACCTTT